MTPRDGAPVPSLGSLPYLFYGVGLVFLCSRTLPEDGTPVPKHVTFCYLSRVVFYQVTFLVNVLITPNVPKLSTEQQHKDLPKY